jgi:hypothetical protein
MSGAKYNTWVLKHSLFLWSMAATVSSIGRNFTDFPLIEREKFLSE